VDGIITVVTLSALAEKCNCTFGKGAVISREKAQNYKIYVEKKKFKTVGIKIALLVFC